MLDAENPAESSDAPVDTPVDTPDAPVDTPDAPVDTPDAPVDADGEAAPAKKAAAKRTAAKKATAKKAAVKKTAAKRTTKKAAAGEAVSSAASEETETATSAAVSTEAGSGEVADQHPVEVPATSADGSGGESPDEPAAPAAKRTAKKTAKKTAAKRTTKKAAAAPESGEVAAAVPSTDGGLAAGESGEEEETEESAAAAATAPATPPSATALLFQPPDPTKAVTRRRRPAKTAESGAAGPAAGQGTEGDAGDGTSSTESQKPAKKAAKKTAKKPAAGEAEATSEAPQAEVTGEEPSEQSRQGAGHAEGDEDQAGERRRRRRGGRRRRRSGGGEDNESAEGAETSEESGGQRADQGNGEHGESEDTEESAAGTRRRRRRRRSGEGGEGADDSEGTVTRVRKPRNAEDEITALSGSTRLEAKKQRRREGREAGRRRAPIVSEAEFLARRESVDRVMVIRQREDLTQIAVLEDKVLVEHYVARESQTSLIGNVYLGRVQNVLPSMEAAFIDIGKGRNAVLYAGEVNWDALGAKNGTPRKIEAVLKSGQSILVQVTKDPIGHKGARLTSQVSLPGRFLVYVPDGTTSGISRKLPDTERNRLKALLKDIVPDTAGVIVRTAAEGASEEELTRDVERLTARWADIESKVNGGNAPQLLYGEPDLTLKVVRDLFTEDFNKLVIAGDDAWDLVDGYVSHVAPDLADRLERYDEGRDVFAEYRIDEQIEKALDRKVWLPSGGSLVIDRTEAMTVVDVNTGKFTGSGGNLEETVTKNNLEAAEEIVRQLRLRDIGGIIVVDFIDMVLESNRDLVLRRMVECLGRDRTRHQVAEVTSLGLVQMTRKRIGTGLLEAFSETCEHCQGRGLVLHHEPVEPKKKTDDDSRRGGRRSGRGRGRDEGAAAASGANGGGVPSPKDIAAMAKPEEKGEAEAEGERQAQQAEAVVAQTPGQHPDGVSSGQVAPDEAEAAAGDELAETRPSGRSRGGRGRGGRGRGSKGSQADHAAEGTTEAAESTEVAETSQPAASEAAPEVSTSGRPEESAASEQPEQASAEDRTEDRGEAGEQPKGAEEAQAEAAPSEPAAPAAPKIVTSVRRRSARRPAGPPVGAGASSAAPVAPDTVNESVNGSTPSVPGLETTDTAVPPADGGDVDDHGLEAPATPHVPVKKKGSRRR